MHGVFNKGYYPRVSINDDGMIVVVFTHQIKKKLFCRLGKLKYESCAQAPPVLNASIEWLQKKMPLSDGLSPAVSISKSNVVAVAYEKGFHTFYRIGHIRNGEIMWPQEEDKLLIESFAKHASIAVNDKGQVVVGYSSWAERAVHYRAGQITDGHTLTLSKDKFTPSGANYQPVISLNNHGNVVAVYHCLQGRLYVKYNYRLIKQDPATGLSSINWLLEQPKVFANDSYYASVVLCDTMKVVTAYKSLSLKFKTSIRNRIGQLNY